MSGAPDGARRPPRSGGTLPALGFSYAGREPAPRTLNNGAPAPPHHLNNGSLRSLPDKKAHRNGVLCHPENFQRNLDTRYSRKLENGYLRNCDSMGGYPRERERERAVEREIGEYSEPEYSVIAEGYGPGRACSHSNTFNC
ncbi:unnamed protein product [Leptidea sinapis]|uniref:Uncharacterized protein n=1 Tax=Leptidea sinapis TaxID=189913 RepID=A0A5E4QXY6_9NEOP|nr:unnamed protein product [Leptidea sinapis]